MTEELVALPWQAWIMPGLLTVLWAWLWLQDSRALRLWFALCAPPASFVMVVLTIAQGMNGPTDGEVSHFLAGVDDAGATMGAVNAMLTLFVSVPLFLTTLVVEYVLLVRRQNRE